MNQVNNSGINKVGNVGASQSAGTLGKLATAGLLALSSIVSGFNSQPPSATNNLAQATSAAINNLS